MKSIWNCSLSLNGLCVPVQLFSAVTKSKPPFQMVDTRSMSPIGINHYNKLSNLPVPKEHLGKALKINDMMHLLTPKIIKSCTPAKNNAINFDYLVPAMSIPSVYFDIFYYAVPEVGAEKNYDFLLHLLSYNSIVGISQTVFRNQSTIFALTCFDAIILLHKLRFPSQFIDVPDPLPPKPAARDASFVQSMDDFIATRTADFDLSSFRDSFSDDLVQAVRNNISERG